jgi:hypothetical protein
MVTDKTRFKQLPGISVVEPDNFSQDEYVIPGRNKFRDKVKCLDRHKSTIG